MWYLAQFDLQICHISGKDNNMADCLSRAHPYPDDHDEMIDEKAVPIAILTAVSGPQLPSPVSAFPPPLPTLETVRLAKSKRLYIPLPLRESILYWFHASTQGGHRGINATTRRIAKYFWWPKIAQSVSTYIEHCMFCSRNAVPVANNLRSTLSRPSHSYVGPIFFNGENHHYSVIDHATRFVVCQSTTYQSTSHVISVLRDFWLNYFGAPHCVLSDRGAVFVSGEYTSFITKALGAYALHTSPYYPQGNAINEASHQIIPLGTPHTRVDLVLVPCLMPRGRPSRHQCYISQDHAIYFEWPKITQSIRTPS
eukprot:GHVH01013691.1.p1 GENE.GHVH01013691.1~~GHVH01013691.1.p1  ORF type:complete len:311 (-),score=20.20 GHVH01013691.1:566-1498(-)